jgi:hypothetical protein
MVYLVGNLMDVNHLNRKTAKPLHQERPAISSPDVIHVSFFCGVRIASRRSIINRNLGTKA